MHACVCANAILHYVLTLCHVMSCESQSQRNAAAGLPMSMPMRMPTMRRQNPTFTSRTSHDLVSADTNGHMNMKIIQRMPPMLRPPMRCRRYRHYTASTTLDRSILPCHFSLVSLLINDASDGTTSWIICWQIGKFFTTILFTSASVRNV